MVMRAQRGTSGSGDTYPSMKPQMSSSSVTASITRIPLAPPPRECFAARAFSRTNQRFAEVRAGGAGDAYAGEFDEPVSGDEIEQPPRRARAGW